MQFAKRAILFKFAVMVAPGRIKYNKGDYGLFSRVKYGEARRKQNTAVHGTQRPR